MADANAQPVALLDGKITGFQQFPNRATDQPIIVFLHGGGSSAAETLIPGHSQLGLAAQLGHPAFALNRPGYLDSPALGFPGTTEEGWFAASAERLDDAIAEIWRLHSDAAPGIVVHGCSIGGGVALTLASRWTATADRGEERWPLLGVAVEDIGIVAPQAVVERWRQTEPTEFVPDLRVGVADLPLPPTWTTTPIPDDVPDVPARVPRDELLEVTGGWQRNWRGVATSIRVPVHYRLAEYDVLWEVNDALVDEAASAFRTRSPYVNAGVTPGASHAIMVSPMADAYNLQVMAFVAQCGRAARTPQVLADHRQGVEGTLR